MTPATWNAVGPRGNVLASFNTRDLAERYKADREKIGLSVSIVRVVMARRAAA